MKIRMLLTALFIIVTLSCVTRGNNDKEFQNGEAERLYFEDSLTSGGQIGLQAGEIALTLDDGPISESLWIAKKLVELEVPVTYFMIGSNVNSDSGMAIAKEMAALRFTSGPNKGELATIIANHSMHHKRAINSVPCAACDGVDYAISEIRDADNLLAPLIKQQNKPFLFRAPGGNFYRRNRSDEVQDLAVVNEVMGKYIGPFWWDVDGDVNPGVCQNGAQACRNFYASQTESIIHRHGVIVLAHDVSAMTRKMLLGDRFEGYISMMKSRGYKFVAMDKYPDALGQFGTVPRREIGVVNYTAQKQANGKYHFTFDVKDASRIEVYVDGMARALFVGEGSSHLDAERSFSQAGTRQFTIKGYNGSGLVGQGSRAIYIEP